MSSQREIYNLCHPQFLVEYISFSLLQANATSLNAAYLLSKIFIIYSFEVSVLHFALLQFALSFIRDMDVFIK